jgi:hypothetical protein
MSALRPGTLRRALAPLGAMLALGLLAGLLLGRQLSTPDLSRVVAADGTVRPTDTPPGLTTAGVTQPGDVPVGGRPAAGGPAGQHPIEVSPTYLGGVGVGVPRSALYAFLLMQPDHVTPIRWNPCRPVHYKVATDDLVPASEIPQVRAAFDDAGRAMGGVRFVYDGTTAVIPEAVDDSARAATDIVFAFAVSGGGPYSSKLLTGWEAGRGGFAAWGPTRADGRTVELPTHGSVVVDASKWKDMTRHDRTLLYLHEIGHVVGLDHPRDQNQVMTSGAYDLPPAYQKGDLEGLALLGRRAGCVG